MMGDGLGCRQGNLMVCVLNHSRTHPWRKGNASRGRSWSDELRGSVPVGKEQSNKNQRSTLCRVCAPSVVTHSTLHTGLGGRQFPEVRLLFRPATGPVGRQSHLHATQEATSLGGGMGSEARGDELWGAPKPPWSWERWERADECL